jgi:hypothetical protein
VDSLRRGALLCGLGLLLAAPLLWFALGMHEGLLLSGGIRSKVAPWAPFYAARGPTVDALSDPVWQFVPWIEIARRELRAGRAPLWNPHQDGGVPLLGNAQSALGSPLLWPALLAGVGAGWNLSLLLRILVALGSAWLWLRDLGRSAAGALLGAVAFALSGPFVAWLEHPQTLTAAAVPLLLLFARRTASAPTRSSFFGLAAATALVLAGGHPETQLMAALLAAVVAVHAAPRARAVLTPLGAACIGAGLAAPLLLPFAEYLRLSEAWRGIGRQPFVLSGADLLRFVLPHGVPGSNVIEAAATVSLTVLVLAIAGLPRIGRDREVRFWAAVAGTILLVTYDNPVARLLALHTPVHWTRALLFLPLACGFLASGSLDRLLAAVARGGRLRARAAIGAAVVAAASAELLGAARGVHGRTPASELRITTPLLERLADDRDLFRVLPLHTFLPPDSASAYGLDDVRGYDALSPLGWRERRRAIGAFHPLPTQTDALEPRDLGPGGAALDFWNVKYLLLDPRFGFGAEELNARLDLDLEQVYAGPDGKILRNRRVRPRARLELEGGGTVRVERRVATAWRLDLTADRPNRLILADPFFPGWQASLDGRRAGIEAEPGDPIAIPVPPGRHRVEISYRPLSWRVGWALALAAAIVLAVVLRSSPDYS